MVPRKVTCHTPVSNTPKTRQSPYIAMNPETCIIAVKAKVCVLKACSNNLRMIPNRDPFGDVRNFLRGARGTKKMIGHDGWRKQVNQQKILQNGDFMMI